VNWMRLFHEVPNACYHLLFYVLRINALVPTLTISFPLPDPAR